MSLGWLGRWFPYPGFFDDGVTPPPWGGVAGGLLRDACAFSDCEGGRTLRSTAGGRSCSQPEIRWRPLSRAPPETPRDATFPRSVVGRFFALLLGDCASTDCARYGRRGCRTGRPRGFAARCPLGSCRSPLHPTRTMPLAPSSTREDTGGSRAPARGVNSATTVSRDGYSGCGIGCSTLRGQRGQYPATQGWASELSNPPTGGSAEVILGPEIGRQVVQGEVANPTLPHRFM